MRKMTMGRIGVTMATAAAAIAGAVAMAPAAGAATANSCLQQLTARHSWGYDETMTTTGSLTFYTHEYYGSPCAGMSVSLGISRTNTAGFRNQNARSVAMTSGTGGYTTTYKFGVDDYGSWMTRQIAVKDRSGKLAVKTFTSKDTPRTLTIRFASVLKGTPKGRLTGAKVAVNGSLQSWHYSGRLVNVQNQKVVVQVRKPHESGYVTKATATTSRTGTFATTLNTAGLKGYDVRIAFVSGIPMTASSYTFLGTIS
jgi:hypothetical protein